MALGRGLKAFRMQLEETVAGQGTVVTLMGMGSWAWVAPRAASHLTDAERNGEAALRVNNAQRGS
jgi:hypothetical protein